MRIVIQIDTNEPNVQVTTQPAGQTGDSGAAAAPGGGGGGGPLDGPVDAGPPAEGEALGRPTEQAIHGETIDAGEAPATVNLPSSGDGAGASGGDGDIDAGSAPDGDAG